MCESKDIWPIHRASDDYPTLNLITNRHDSSARMPALLHSSTMHENHEEGATMMPTQIRLGIWIACTLALLMAVAATAQAAEAAILHVAADGNDAWSGTLGVSPGTVIRNNVFHDVISCPRVSGGWGIYFDEGSTDILAENNLVYNTLTGTLHQHYGRENRVQNNIFAFSHRGQLIRSREEEHNSFFFERNIVYFNNNQLLGSTWKNGNFDLDSNCYWSSVEEDLDFAGRTIEEWRAEGHDEHSIIADPGFVNAEAADFRLKPDSPALKVGFKPFDFSTSGLYGEPEWVNKP